MVETQARGRCDSVVCGPIGQQSPSLAENRGARLSSSPRTSRTCSPVSPDLAIARPGIVACPVRFRASESHVRVRASAPPWRLKASAPCPVSASPVDKDSARCPGPPARSQAAMRVRNRDAGDAEAAPAAMPGLRPPGATQQRAADPRSPIPDLRSAICLVCDLRAICNLRAAFCNMRLAHCTPWSLLGFKRDSEQSAASTARRAPHLR